MPVGSQTAFCGKQVKTEEDQVVCEWRIIPNCWISARYICFNSFICSFTLCILLIFF